jgi:SP family arabinose:H+ symporter-like MFS transporter
MSNSYVLRGAQIAAMVDFLFEFDTVVISGAEKMIQNIWPLGVDIHGLEISMTLLGSLIGARLIDKFGRQKTLLREGFLYFTSAVRSAFVSKVYSFMIARFISGLGVGISTIAAMGPKVSALPACVNLYADQFGDGSLLGGATTDLIG